MGRRAGAEDDEGEQGMGPDAEFKETEIGR